MRSVQLFFLRGYGVGKSDKRNEHGTLTGGICQTVAVYDFSLEKRGSNTNILNTLNYPPALPRYLPAELCDQPR